jgi:hypothetical protein
MGILIFWRDNSSNLKNRDPQAQLHDALAKELERSCQCSEEIEEIQNKKKTFGAHNAFREPCALGSMFTLGVLLVANSAGATGQV